MFASCNGSSASHQEALSRWSGARLRTYLPCHQSQQPVQDGMALSLSKGRCLLGRCWLYLQKELHLVRAASDGGYIGTCKPFFLAPRASRERSFLCDAWLQLPSAHILHRHVLTCAPSSPPSLSCLPSRPPPRAGSCPPARPCHSEVVPLPAKRCALLP
jgi:hypothetical protein